MTIDGTFNELTKLLVKGVNEELNQKLKAASNTAEIEGAEKAVLTETMKFLEDELKATKEQTASKNLTSSLKCSY